MLACHGIRAWHGQKKTIQAWACALGTWLGLACVGLSFGPELGLKWVAMVELGLDKWALVMGLGFDPKI